MIEIELPDYATMYGSAVLSTNPRCVRELNQVCKIALTHADLYKAVQRLSGVPWPLIAALHFRESGQSFNQHLHNGDPLGARTVHVPKGRPQTGTPPFTWIESAADALSEVWIPHEWDLVGSLAFLEHYNGFGYLEHGINTPYLWDYTSEYRAGLYTGDGKLDPALVEARPGCVAIVKTLAAKGVTLDFAGLTTDDCGLH